MKRFYSLLVSITTLLVMVVVVSTAIASPVGEKSSVPTFSSTIYPCKYDYTDAKEMYLKNTIHVRNAVLYNYGATDDGAYNVKTIETLSWNFNSSIGEGVVSGPITQEYSDASGKIVGVWVGTIEGKVSMDESGVPLAVGKGVFDGEGLFEGLRMKSIWRQEPYFDPPAACIGHEPTTEGDERPAYPVRTFIDHYVIETTGTWPPGE
jgi:hypothetical protein